MPYFLHGKRDFHVISSDLENLTLFYNSQTSYNTSKATFSSKFCIMSQATAQPQIAPPPTRKWTSTPRNQEFARMRQLRQAVLRDGKWVKEDRPEHVYSRLAHVVGREERQPCSNCDRGAGPFAACVTMAGEFENACTNCVYRGMQVTCTFRLCKSFHT
jgi:hypothetical protein